MPVYDFHCPVHGLLPDLWIRSSQFAKEIKCPVVTESNEIPRDDSGYVTLDLTDGSQCCKIASYAVGMNTERPGYTSMQPDTFWSGVYCTATDSFYNRKSSFKADLERRNFQIKEPGMDKDAASNLQSIASQKRAAIRSRIEGDYTSGKLQAKLKETESKLKYEANNGPISAPISD